MRSSLLHRYRPVRRRLTQCFALILIASTAPIPILNASATDDLTPPTKLQLGPIGDWALARDNATLVVSRPNAAELVYLDTVAGVEKKRIELEFAPNQLAIQNDTLFASVRGAAFVYALNVETGEVTRRFKLQGEPVIDLCCHPTKGLVFAANLNEEIFSLSPSTGAVTQTKGRGTMLAVDPHDGSFLLAATNRPGQDFIEFQTASNVDRLRLVTVVDRASVLKYAIEGEQIRLVAGNINAAFGETGNLSISQDGKRFAMSAGGGWRSMTSKRFHYVIAVFETADMETMLGQVDLGAYPRAIAFHPILNLGAAVRHGTDLQIKLFKANSFAERHIIKLDTQGPGPLLKHKILFCGQGSSLVHHFRDTLTLIPLPLGNEEKAALADRNHQ